MNKKIEEYNNYHKSSFSSSMETFTNYSYDDHLEIMYNNSLENYKKGQDFNNYNVKINYNDNIRMYDVKKDFPLITYGCIQSKLSDNLFEDLKKYFYISSYEFYSLSIDDIYEKIISDLNSTIVKLKQDKLDEPVFIVIYQAPYLYFNNEQVIARHDISNNLKSSYEQDINNVKIGMKKLFTKLFIIYPKYNIELKKYTNNEGIKKFHEYLKPKLSRNKLCFLECNKINPYSCGCLNRDKSDNSDNFYKSACIEYTNEKFDYGMIYSLNKFNTMFKNLFKHNGIIM